MTEEEIREVEEYYKEYSSDVCYPHELLKEVRRLRKEKDEIIKSAIRLIDCNKECHPIVSFSEFQREIDGICHFCTAIENKKLRKALEFYANDANYEAGDCDAGYCPEPSIMYYDRGNHAREALEKK